MDIEEINVWFVGREWLKAFPPRLKGLQPFQPYNKAKFKGR